MRRLVVIALSLILSACAGRGMMVKQEPPSTKPDEAVIIFLADPGAGFTSISVTLYDITEPSVKFIGVIDQGTKVAYAVKPGTYAFMVLATSTDFMEASVVAGKRYFAIVSAEYPKAVGTLRYRLKAVRQAELSSSDFISMERNAAYAAKTARADDWYANSKNAASVAARREKFFPAWFRKSPQERDSQVLRAEDGQ